MVLVLIITLIFIKIGIQLIMLSLDISFAVTDRLDSIRRKGEGFVEDKVMQSQKVNNATKLATGSIMGIKRTGEGVLRVGLHTGKLAAKAVLKLLKLVLSILIDALIALEGMILVVDLILFVVFTAIAFFYMNYMDFFK